MQKGMFYLVVSIKAQNFHSVIFKENLFMIAGTIKKLPISEKGFSKTGSNLIFAEIVPQNDIV